MVELTSLGASFNPASTESKIQHRRRLLMQPAIVLPYLLHDFHYSFFIFVQFQTA